MAMDELPAGGDPTDAGLLRIEGVPLALVGDDEPFDSGVPGVVPGPDLGELLGRSLGGHDGNGTITSKRHDVERQVSCTIRVMRDEATPWLVIMETYIWEQTRTSYRVSQDIFGARVTLKVWPSLRPVLQRYTDRLWMTDDLAIEAGLRLVRDLASELAWLADEPG